MRADGKPGMSDEEVCSLTKLLTILEQSLCYPSNLGALLMVLSCGFFGKLFFCVIHYIYTFIQRLTLDFFPLGAIDNFYRTVTVVILAGYGFCITLPTGIPCISAHTVQRGAEWFESRSSAGHRHRRK
jgi:hypothetical protein